MIKLLQTNQFMYNFFQFHLYEAGCVRFLCPDTIYSVYNFNLIFINVSVSQVPMKDFHF